MRYELFDYQRESALGCLSRLDQASDAWTKYESRSAFALSALTGAGKTVIATAVIEALLHGSVDLGIDADPRALFLWVTDDPALNRQTRDKMIAASDVLDPARLVELNDGFLDPILKPGRVYFLNIQQLASSAGFAKGGNNLRQHSGWDILRNTIAATDRDVYVVLDEAHRGMKSDNKRPTIVQRIIGGQPGSNPPVPVVWGISATIERFTAAMKAHEGSRATLPAVSVSVDKVRDAGIIKDQIELDQPDEKGDFHSTLLRSAAKATKDFEARWATYHAEEHEPLVLPILVVQVADKSSDAHLTEIVSTIESEWGTPLAPDAVVNVFGEHADLVLGGRKVGYVNPETIQAREHVRVVLAKTAISTGWDCPRAEVLFSERPASDVTHIAQVIGRMVRSPLAHRVATDDALNSVACFLPRFDKDAVAKVVEEITKPGEIGAVIEVVTHARVFDRNPKLPAKTFEVIEALPSWPKPDALADPIRRAKSLVKLLTDDTSGPALMANAGAALDEALHSKLDGLAAQFKKQVAANVADLEGADLHKTVFVTGGDVKTTDTYTVATSLADLDRETRKVVGSLKEGVGKTYLKYRVEEDAQQTDELTIRTDVAALIRVDGVRDAVGAEANAWVQARLAQYEADLKLTTGVTKVAYMKIKEMTSTQEATGIELPTTMKSPTRSGIGDDAVDLPTFPGHLYADQGGLYPAALNDWESTVIKTETARDAFVAWYRNPSRATTAALRIGHEAEPGKWVSLQVDFVIVSKRPDGELVASLVDPHGDHLADAVSKLRALADYAERFGDRFARIESVAKGSGEALRRLDLLDPKVREAVRGHNSAQSTSLYDDDAIATAYV